VVQIALPPPQRPPQPVHHKLLDGTRLIRIYDPTSHGATATSFREFGPLNRFDHQCPAVGGVPHVDAGRGVLYAGLTLSCCVAEVFGDRGTIDPGTNNVAELIVTRALVLLDLRGNGAMRAGTVAALAKTADRPVSQAWARYFYENPVEYGVVDGIVWLGAHNDEECLLLYERAHRAIVCPPGATMNIDDPLLRLQLLTIARQLHLVPPP